MTRSHWLSGSPWELAVGYARVVRVGRHVFVSGTVAADENGNVMGGSDAGAQAAYIFDKILRALKEVGAGPEHVVRTRMYVTDTAAQSSAVGRAHSEVFKNVRPASTMVEISGLMDPKFLVEIEADAIIS